ncbi:MAG TPA: 3D domain-containing protein [Pyrinomonadaceae bacterium]|nr:3D domain-containing protein [Pyrinomonadaceae bacterium]
MKATIGRGAFILGAFVFGLIAFSATPSIAETLLSPFQTLDKSKQEPPTTLGKAETSTPTANVEERPIVPAAPYVATAYSLRGRTASGRMVGRGLIAADPRVLPLGSRVRLDHPGYSGEYLVADTGGLIRGRRIDIWTPSSREAMRFGRRTVKLTVLSYPAKRTRRSAKG